MEIRMKFKVNVMKNEPYWQVQRAGLSGLIAFKDIRSPLLDETLETVLQRFFGVVVYLVAIMHQMCYGLERRGQLSQFLERGMNTPRVQLAVVEYRIKGVVLCKEIEQVGVIAGVAREQDVVIHDDAVTG